MKNNGKKIFGFFLITISILSLAFWKYYSDINSPVDKSDDTEISFQVKKGESVKEIAKKLEEQELINSSTFFYWHTKYNKLGEKILAGRFILKKSMNVPQIIEVISDPSEMESILTIQEGLRIRDVDEKLSTLGLINSGDLIKEAKNFNGWEYYDFLDPKIQADLEIPVEGYIYPDTYFLDPMDFQTHDLLYLALDNFEKKLSRLDFDNSEINKKYSLQEIITMASIIENEVFGKKDRALVSGILWKRLENNWTIGADATLLYITDDRTITKKDLEIDSPYNTRKNQGLPPGPISNPSSESIQAALYPEESPYWFYLTTLDTGEVIYGKTNEEHNLNRTKHL